MQRFRRRMLRQYVGARRFVYRQLLRATDSPHQLALGVAIAVFLALTPTVGFQSLLVVAVAWMLRANKIVGLPLVWISNPATFVPIYYPCYRLGLWLFGLPARRRAWWKELAHPPAGWWDGVRFYWGRMAEIWIPLWAGCLVVATAAGVSSYFGTRLVLTAYRRARRLA